MIFIIDRTTTTYCTTPIMRIGDSVISHCPIYHAVKPVMLNARIVQNLMILPYRKPPVM